MSIVHGRRVKKLHPEQQALRSAVIVVEVVLAEKLISVSGSLFKRDVNKVSGPTDDRPGDGWEKETPHNDA